MKSTLNKLEKSKVELIVELDEKSWKSAQEKAFDKLIKNVNLPGFRKGKVPTAMAKKHVSEQSVLLESVETLAQSALVSAVEEHKIDLIARPDLEIVKLSKEECTLKFVCSVRPEVKLGDYKGLEIKKSRVMVKNEEIDAELEKIANDHSTLEVVDRAVENGDTAVIDFEGFKDGVAFEGGKGENYPLEIGSGSFIPGFEEQLVGMKSEETKDITVTFPENYQAEELAGKEVVFKVTVHEVKVKVKPEVTDELIEELAIEDVKTVEEFKKHVKESIRVQKQEEVDNKYLEEVLAAVKEKATFEIPAVMIEEETEAMLEDFKQRITKQGFTIELYEQLSGQTLDSIKATMSSEAEKRVGTRLVLEEVVKAENIDVNDEDYDAEIEKLAKLYQQTQEVIKNAIPKDAISYEIKLRKALELLREENKA